MSIQSDWSRVFLLAVVGLVVSLFSLGWALDGSETHTRAISYDEGWVVHDVAVSPLHDYVVRGRYHNELGKAELWIEEADSGLLKSRQQAWGVIRSFEFSEDGSTFVASADHGPIKVLETKTGNVLAELDGHSGWVHAVGISGGIVASAGRDDTFRVWDAETGKEIWSKADTCLANVAVAPDGLRVAGTDGSGNLILWDAATGEELQTLETGESGWSFHVVFSQDGKHVAAGSKNIRVFAVESGDVVGSVQVDEKKRASAIAICNGGKRLAASVTGAGLKVWEVIESQVLHEWPTRRTIGSLRFSEDGVRLCGAQYTGKCHQWNLDDGKLVEPKQNRSPWIKTESDVDELMLSMDFFDTWRGIAVGGNTETGPSVVMISVDDGQSWCRHSLDSKGRLYSIDIQNNETAVAVGYGGVVIRTRDRGENWETVETPAKHWLAAVDFIDATTGYVVGGSADHPVLWKTTDGGDTWKPIHERLPEDTVDCQLRDVKFLSMEHGFAVGTDGLLLETRDAGETWQRKDAGTEAWLRAISHKDEVIHIAGKGVLLRSEDLGKTWSKMPIPEKRKLVDVVFATRDHGWITNFDGEILETRDAGQTWNAVHVHDDVTTGLHLNAERTLVLTGDGQVLRQRR